jgi:hypothetical protein
MKRFLFSFIKFIFPVIVLICGIEMYVLYYPSTFNKKAKYLKQHTDSIKTIILGSSHNQNALNPEFLNSQAINLANAGQDIQIDAALFFKNIGKLTSVNKVILEIDYHSLEEKNGPDYFRIPWYYRFYDIEIYPVSFLNRFSVYASSPSFFNQLILDEINPKKIRYKLNQFGFIMNDFPGVMEDLKYDSLKLAETAMERLKDKHVLQSVDNCNYNKSKLNTIIDYCIKNNIEVILISTPMYSTYINHQITAKNIRRMNYIDSLKNLSNIYYYNFENSNKFGVHDFKNDDHLNSIGSKKFTLIIDSLLNSAK